MTNTTDTNQVATKADIQRLEQSTKKDIQELRSEIKAQRSDSKRTEKSLRTEILKVEGRVENIETRVTSMDAKLDKLQNTLDGFVGRVSTLTEENQVGAHHTRQLRIEVDAHEKRIKHLESLTQTI